MKTNVNHLIRTLGTSVLGRASYQKLTEEFLAEELDEVSEGVQDLRATNSQLYTVDAAYLEGVIVSTVLDKVAELKASAAMQDGSMETYKAINATLKETVNKLETEVREMRSKMV